MWWSVFMLQETFLSCVVLQCYCISENSPNCGTVLPSPSLLSILVCVYVHSLIAPSFIAAWNKEHGLSNKFHKFNGEYSEVSSLVCIKWGTKYNDWAGLMFWFSRPRSDHIQSMVSCSTLHVNMFTQSYMGVCLSRRPFPFFLTDPPFLAPPPLSSFPTRGPSPVCHS